MYTLKYATSSLISGLLISDLFLLFHALLVLNYTTTFNPLYYRKIFLMPFLASSRVQMLSLTIQMKKHFYRRHVCFKCTDFFVLSEENENGDTDALQYTTQQGKWTKFSVQYFWRAPHRQERDLEKKYIILSSSEVRRLPCVVI